MKLIVGAFIPLGTSEPFRCGLCVLALAAVLWDLRRNPGLLCLVLLSFLGWSYVFVFKNPWCWPWHTGLMDCLLIVALWMVRAERHVPAIRARIRVNRRWRRISGMTIGEALVFGSLAISVLDVPQIIFREIHEPFSNAKEMAVVIRGLEGKATIATYPSAKSQSILPYLPDRHFRFWHIETESPGALCKETVGFEAFQATTQAEVLAPIQRRFPAVKPWILLGGPLPMADADGYRLFYHSPQRAWGHGGENFWLYQPTTSGW